LLSNVSSQASIPNDKLREVAFKYKSQGLTVRQIASKMNADGYEIGKTKVAQLLNSAQLF
jgi:DNA-binding transcriptional regulator LsrR (DeoR family)